MKLFLLIYLKGMAMGVADVVPGVSGGTIAFITGIYQRFLNALKGLNFQNFKLLLRFRFRAFGQATDFLFLGTLMAGILTSVLTVSKLVKYLLEQQPVLLWAFFFGLILGASQLMIRRVGKWSLAHIGWLLLGGMVAFAYHQGIGYTVTRQSFWVFCGGLFRYLGDDITGHFWFVYPVDIGHLRPAYLYLRRIDLWTFC